MPILQKSRMPDPALYLQAMIVSALASALVALVLGRFCFRSGPAANLNGVVGLCVGLVVGYGTLRTQFVWPPMKGLDRLLEIVLPLSAAIELIATRQRSPRWLVWTLRMILAAAAPRILLHDSVYLGGPASPWTASQTWRLLIISAAVLASEWYLLAVLVQRRAGTSLLLSMAAATQCGGVAVMLAGYVTGGAASIPLAAAVVGLAIANSISRWNTGLSGVLSVSVVGQFGVLFVGAFFGALTTQRTLILFCAPLLCWISELPWLRQRPVWQVVAFRLIVVAIPLLAVLILAKRDFDQKTLPLL